MAHSVIKNIYIYIYIYDLEKIKFFMVHRVIKILNPFLSTWKKFEIMGRR